MRPYPGLKLLCQRVGSCMIYDYADVRVLQIEGTQACNADCPMCIRRGGDGLVIRGLANQRPMRLLDYARLLTPEFVQQLAQISLCGNYGDPMLMPYLDWILDMTRANSKLAVTAETNGGMHLPPWWAKLATALNPGSRVTFNIDGLRDTLGVYRRKVDYDTVIANAQAFIAAGGNATWSFLPFRHNEHQVDEARDLAKQLGFTSFEVRVTERFFRNDGSELESYTKSGTTLYPAKNPAYQFKREGTQAEYLATLSSCKVSCRASTGKRVYVDYAGYVFPCCFVAAVHGEDCADLGTTMIRDKLATYSKDKQPTLSNYSLREIVAGDFFKWVYDHFDTPADRPIACSAVCGAGLFKTSK